MSLPGQMSLFAAPPARRDHPDTSHGAAASMATKAASLRAKVLAFLLDRGVYGATDEEIQHALDMNPSTQRPRRVELMRAGYVRGGERRRPTTSGRPAMVWSAVDKGGDPWRSS